MDLGFRALDARAMGQALSDLQDPPRRGAWERLAGGIARLQELSWEGARSRLEAWRRKEAPPPGLLHGVCDRHATGERCGHSVAEVVGREWRRGSSSEPAATKMIGSGLVLALYPETCTGTRLYSHTTHLALRALVGPEARPGLSPRSEYECFRQRALRVLAELERLLGLPAEERPGRLERLVPRCARTILAQDQGGRPRSSVGGATEGLAFSRVQSAFSRLR